MKRLHLYATTLFLAFALSACASLGAKGPITFNDKTYAAISAVDQVQKTAATLVRAKKITADDAENVLKAADAALVGVGVARTYSKSDAVAADAKLQATLAALAIVQGYLATKGATP